MRTFYKQHHLESLTSPALPTTTSMLTVVRRAHPTLRPALYLERPTLGLPYSTLTTAQTPPPLTSAPTPDLTAALATEEPENKKSAYLWYNQVRPCHLPSTLHQLTLLPFCRSSPSVSVSGTSATSSLDYSKPTSSTVSGSSSRKTPPTTSRLNRSNRERKMAEPSCGLASKCRRRYGRQ